MKTRNSQSVTARSARDLITYINHAIVMHHDVIVSTNSPAVTAVIVDAIVKYNQFDTPVNRNQRFSLTAVVDFLSAALDLKGMACAVVIAPKSIPIGVNLPENTTRIIVDDAGVFLGEVMAQIEFMKKESGK